MIEDIDADTSVVFSRALPAWPCEVVASLIAGSGQNKEQSMALKPLTPRKTPARKPAVPAEGNGARNGASGGSSEENVRLLAYLKWEAAGKPVGDGLRYWLEAERELCPA
jgi:hypothetical protein